MQQTNKKKNKKPMSFAASAVPVTIGEPSLAAVKVEQNNNETAEMNGISIMGSNNPTTKNAKKPNRKKGAVNSTPCVPNGIDTPSQAAVAAVPAAKQSQTGNVGGSTVAAPAPATPIDPMLAAQQRSKPAKKTNKTSEMLQGMSNTSVNKKLDDVLHTVRQLDNTCDFSRCKVKTSLIYQDCKLCDQRFCMKHQLPEVHGCGGAVRKTERTEFLKPRTIPISAALRRNEQKDAHARLEQKLKELSLARQKARK